MTKATAQRVVRRRTRGLRAGWALGVTSLLACFLSGCASLPNITPPWRQAATGETPQDSLVLRGNGIEQVKYENSPLAADLDAAKRLLEQGQHDKAQAAFHALRSNRECPAPIREEAIFFEAECQRLQKSYRAAETTYMTLFKDFANTQFTERADKGLFEIAQHWLEETRTQMRQYEEQRKGERWLVTPALYLHFSKDMPVYDAEGHAVRILEHIRMHEINTPLGEQALIYLGTLKFFREDYHEADHYFTELYTRYPNSKHAAKAVKHAIICKQLCTGGTAYDCRTVEESRKLIHVAQTAYPEFSKEDDWIQKQLISINVQQADRDWRVAEFYRRTGHPGSAYFYYEIVRRNYPNTEYARKAAEQIAELERTNGAAVRPGAQNPAGVPQSLPQQPATPPRMLPPSLDPRQAP